MHKTLAVKIATNTRSYLVPFCQQHFGFSVVQGPGAKDDKPKTEFLMLCVCVFKVCGSLYFVPAFAIINVWEGSVRCGR